MTHHPTRSLTTALCTLLLAAGTSLAAPAAPTPSAQVTPAELAAAQARYRQDRALCLADKSHQDRATCLKEAGAALAEARRGGLDTDAARYAVNQRQRCERLSGSEQQDCLTRMRGGGSTEGSVTGGGILRELVTREPAPADAAAVPSPAASR